MKKLWQFILHRIKCWLGMNNIHIGVDVAIGEGFAAAIAVEFNTDNTINVLEYTTGTDEEVSATIKKWQRRYKAVPHYIS